MSSNKKKPIYITLAATLVICIITFFLGFVISSVAFLDSRLEAAREENAELTQTLNEKDTAIKTLKQTIEQKDENNIILGEQIQAHLSTIDSLSAEIETLKADLNSISETAVNNSVSEPEPSASLVTFASLNSTQQFILLIILFIIILIIVSGTCIIISSKSSSQPKKEEKAENPETAEEDNNVSPSLSEVEEEQPQEEEKEPEVEASEEESAEEEKEEEVIEEEKQEEKPVVKQSEKTLSVIDKAIEYLYRNNLESHISELGGFKFGITNFDEVLSDKSRGKSFGNSENGDFVAFMLSESGIKKLYIIPRTMALSDATVALRGITDLFDVKNEAGHVITCGTVKIKTVDAPAVFACGENGWGIESKGKIVALGIKAL